MGVRFLNFFSILFLFILSACDIAPYVGAIDEGKTPASSSALFPISSHRLVSIDISPVSPVIPVGTQTQFTAIGNYDDGSVHNLTSIVSWQSITPSMVILSPTGMAYALQTGNLVISATTAGITATAPVSVPSNQVATPIFSLAAGTYSSSQAIAIYGQTVGSQIYYTTNGLDPRVSGTLYTAPIVLGLNSTTNLKACAKKVGMDDSAIADITYVITGRAEAPTFSPNGGTFPTAQSVTLSSATPGATFRYTVDGSTPNGGSLLYSGPITVSSSQTIKAITVKTGWQNSLESNVSFTITGTVNPPTTNPTPGTFTTPIGITLSAGFGVTIRYTTDGSTPTGSSPIYSNAIPLGFDSSLTVKAIGQIPNWTDSNVMVANYKVTGTVATPVFSVNPGTYTTAQSIAISSSTPGSTIRYTTDGSIPNAGSPVYSAPITVGLNSTMTIKAFAQKFEWADSAVASAAYNVTGTLAPPTFTPVAGAYVGSQNVTIQSSAPGGAIIRYTIDGTTPTVNSQPLFGSLTVSANTTVKAIATKTDWIPSQVATAVYAIAAVPPTFSPPAGTYTTAQVVSLSSVTSGATIRYTLDGSDPNASSPVYSAPLNISFSTTVKAYASKAGMQDSTISTAAYVITSGLLPNPNTITIALANPNATNYYGDDIPAIITLSNFPLTETSATISLSSDATVVGSDTSGTQAIAVMKVGNSTPQPSAQFSMPISNGQSTTPVTVNLRAFNGSGVLNARLKVTAVVGTVNVTNQKIVPVQPKAGFVSADTYAFTNAGDMVDTTTNKGWSISYPTSGNTTRARIRNRGNDSGGNLTIAKFTSGYTAVSARTVAGNTLPEAYVAVGTTGIDVTTTKANRVFGFATNAATPISVNSQGAGTYVLASDVSYLTISAPGYYTICPSSVNYLNLTLDFPFEAGPVLSIYSLRELLNVSQLNPTVALPVDDTYIGGTNLNFVSNLNFGGNLTVGGVSPNHPIVPCP